MSHPIEVTLFDTETAGLQGGVCEIAMVHLNEDLEITWEADSLCDPECEIPAQATAIHGITNDQVAFSPTLSEFLAAAGQPFQRPGLNLMAYNVQFDIRMVKAHLPVRYQKGCLLRLARDIYPDMPDHKLQTLRAELQLSDGGQAHRAMGDVKTSVDLLRRMAQDTGRSLQELFQAGGRRWTPDDKLTFGKHKGMKLANLPASYVVWLLSTDGLDPDLRLCLETRFQTAPAQTGA